MDHWTHRRPPLLIGVIHDYPRSPTAAPRSSGRRAGFDDVAATGRLPGPVEFVHQSAAGLPLPGGSARSGRGRVPCARRCRGARHPRPGRQRQRTRRPAARRRVGHRHPQLLRRRGIRSQCGFHFQIGSLEDEPAFLAAHLAGRGLTRIALIQDSSYIGRRMSEFFEDACAVSGLALVGRTMTPVDVVDVGDAVATVRATSPTRSSRSGCGTSRAR